MASSGLSKSEQLDALYQNFAEGFKEVKGIRASELHQLLESKDGSEVILIDVRTAEEQEVSRIPGHVLTKEKFEPRKEEFRNSALVTYCTAGARSGRYAKQLLQEGFQNVRNFEGSILAWTQAGYPLVTPDDKPTKRVHVCGGQWALQGDGYEPVVFKGGKGVLFNVGSWALKLVKGPFQKNS